MTRRVEVSDLGRMDYKPCWDLQEEVFQGMVKAKIARRNAGLSTTDPGPDGQPDLALPLSRMYWVEHPHVLTLGKSGASANVVAPPERLAELGVQYFPINRGGDITYHGPGQLVGYPILDLDQFFTDIHKYLRFLEEAVIRTCAEYGVVAGRIEGLTGVWIDPESGAEARKICAFGVKCSRWVTMHGLGPQRQHRPRFLQPHCALRHCRPGRHLACPGDRRPRGHRGGEGPHDAPPRRSF